MQSIQRWSVFCVLMSCGMTVFGGEAAPVPRPTEARPLLLGNWPDPTVLKDGKDYYLTHSSLDFQPGLLLWHSQDLRAWKPIGHAVTNQPGSIWAPDLIKHQGIYYLYYPADGGNFVVTATNMNGPWSKPQSLGVGHIDPGHVVAENGQRYVHLSGGHAAELSPAGDKAVSQPRKVYDGWPIPEAWTVECFCLESPKFTVRNGWYYLTSAQGGTAGPATSHMVVSARSRTPVGPWENSPHNPVIRTWSREETWWSKGHGTLVEGPAGQWFCVLHGYWNGQRSLGRCTLMEPMQWTADGWFKPADHWPSGWENLPETVNLNDDFTSATLRWQWQFFRHYDSTRFSVGRHLLTLNGLGADPGASQPLCLMPMHAAYEIETEVEVVGDAVAGLMLFFAPEAYLGLSVNKAGEVRGIQKAFPHYGGNPVARTDGKRIGLRLVNNRQDVRAWWRLAGGTWKALPLSVEISGADHNTLGGWHSVRPALFATGQGQGRFHQFNYRPLP